MRLTTKDSIMGRKHDIKYGVASVWKTKLKNYRYELIEEAIDKLGELEDIEEKHGVELVALFKALEQGAWFVDKRNKNIFFAKCTLCSKLDGKFECTQEEMKFNGFIILEQLFGLGYELKDYGVTWALTREELETQKGESK